jgi:molecular chaperone DnaJ
MNIKDAYTLLGVPENISDSDLKKMYRELAKEKHPDKGGDQNEFESINEADELILDHRAHPEKYQTNPFQNPFVNIHDIFSNFGGGKRGVVNDISVDVSLSFEEAMLGAKRTIAYKHKVKCQDCNGEGGRKIANGCSSCDGFGRVVKNTGNMIFQQSCQKCFGRGTKKENCKKCNGETSISEDVSFEISLPSGIENGNNLRLEGYGNFAGRSPFGDEASAVIVRAKVLPHATMKKNGVDIVSTLDLSLLEALEGKSIEVETIKGKKSITIPPLSKNNDIIGIDGAGVSGTPGKHKVCLNVNYPMNTEDLKNYLKGNANV